MDWSHEFAFWLPAPSDDEPADLRRRIAEELRDHWELALARERLLCGDEEQAVKRVRMRFGDPRSIERKLWFDSMKERIVTQRILMATCLVVSAAATAALALAWRMAGESVQASQALAAQTQQMNQALLKNWARWQPRQNSKAPGSGRRCRPN